MKSIVSKLAGVAALAWMLSTPAQALTYNVTFDGNVFDFTARITTNANHDITALTGIMTGPGNVASPITALIPFSSPSYHNLWVWNNRFTPNAPNVDWYGILWRTANGNVANFYFDSGMHILSVANPGLGNYTYYANGDTAAPAVTAIPLPGAAWLLGSGLLGIFGLGRKRVRAK